MGDRTKHLMSFLALTRSDHCCCLFNKDGSDLLNRELTCWSFPLTEVIVSISSVHKYLTRSCPMRNQFHVTQGCSGWVWQFQHASRVSPLEQSYIAVSVVSLFWASDRQQSFLCVPATLSYLSDYQFSNRHKTNEMERPPCLSSLLILIRQNK